MNELNELLNNAIELHNEMHPKKKVTKQGVAAVLFPSRLPKTQMQNLNNLLNGVTRLHAETVRELVNLFPDTDGDYWLGLTEWDDMYRHFASVYKIDQIDKNPELQALYQMLIDNKYCKDLYNLYL